MTNELVTIARRHGFEQFMTADKNSKWTNAGVLFTTQTSDSNFHSIQNSDFHDHHHQTFCYLCSINQHEHERTKPRDESKRRKLIPYQNPKARLSSSLDRSTPTPSSSDVIPYRFIVRTGTQKNSGTRAQVFLYMYGTEKNWTSIHLQGRDKSHSSTSSDGFPSGSVRTICLKGPNIGQLHHLNVNLVGSRSNKEWFLKEIEVTNLNTSMTWLCEFNCWLPKIDHQESHQIKLNIPLQTEHSLSIYILQIRTGEKSFAGTDANIQIMVRGSKSQIRRLVLTSNRANLFEQNQLDTFAIVGWDLGDLLDITVESDRSQLATDWDVKEMTMWKIFPQTDPNISQVYFPFNTWLGKKVSTLKSKKELYPSTDHHFKGPICYQVIVKTGKVTNAGTDANVFLIIYGKYGRTVIHQLNNRLKNDFERNAISEFTIMDIDIGKIDRIKIWHDNSGAASAWFLDSVTVRKKYSTSQTVSDIYMQRLERISQALYRQIRQQLTKTSTRRQSSVDRHSIKSTNSNDYGTKDRLGSSRGILRSPTMYDKASLNKKVTWDEQSIGSQDDLLSINSQRPTTAEPKQTGHFEHQVYWISSHNYRDKKWNIKSIEEVNSFDFDQSTRSLLLSDRSPQIQMSVHENEDEIYEFQANGWLAKDKEDGKLEVYLPAKLIHASSVTFNQNIEPKKKHLVPPNISSDSQHQKYEGKNKDLKGLKPLTSQTLPLSSSRLPNTFKTQLNEINSIQRNIDPSSRSITQGLKSPRSINDREVSSKIPDQSIYPSRMSAASFLSSSQNIKPSRSDHDLTTAIASQSLRSSRRTKDLTNPLTSEQEELLARITGEPIYRSQLPTTSLTSLSQRTNPSRQTNDPNHLSTGEREILAKISPESFSYSPLSNQHPRSTRLNNEPTSPLPRASGRPPLRPPSAVIRSNPKLPSQKSVHDQVYSSAYGTAPSDDF